MSNLSYTFVMCLLRKSKYMKGVNAVSLWQKSVIFLISTYVYGKTRTKLGNERTPSCSVHHSGQRFVNNWIGFWKKCFFFFMASVILNTAKLSCWLSPKVRNLFQNDHKQMSSYFFWSMCICNKTTNRCRNTDWMCTERIIFLSFRGENWFWFPE